MNSTAQYRAKHYPKEYDRTEAGPHERAEDRTGSRDIKKLYKKCLPGLDRHTVDTVIDGVCRCYPVIRSEDFLGYPAISQITENQNN